MNLHLNLTHKQIFFSILGLIILIASLVFFGLSLSKPYMGIQLSKDADGWMVSAVDPTGLAASKGFAIGDKPFEINGQTAQTFLEKYDEAGTVWSQLISELTVIDNQEQLKSADIESTPQSTSSIIELAMWFIVCIVFWITGFYVFLKKPDSDAALLLYICSLVIGLIFSAISAGSRGITIAIIIEIAATIIGPWMLVHFFHVLPEDNDRKKRSPWFYLIYLPALITIILFPLIGYEDGQPVMWFRSLRLIEYGIAFIAAAGVAVFNFIRATSNRTKQQMKIMLIGCFAALIPMVAFNMLPQAIWGQEKTIIPAGFSVLFIAAIPISMAHAIVTHKLMDIDVIIRRSVVYGLITIFMAIILSAAILISIAFRDTLDTPQLFVVGVALGGVATALFGPTKRGLEFLVDKYIYKDRYDYRQIIKILNNSLNTMKDLTEISRMIVVTTVGNLNLNGGCLFVKNQQDIFEVSAAQGTFTEDSTQEVLQKMISTHSINSEFPNYILSDAADVSFLIPLKTGEQEVGILFLSQKKSRQDFSSNDLYLIEEIASIAAMSLHSALLIRDVSARDTFVSIASHELRSPLTSVLGYSELLLSKNPPDPTRKQWLNYIINNTRKVTTMVDDLLNVSRIQSGRVVMKLEKVNVWEIFDDQLSMLQNDDGNHKFIIDIESDLPDIKADHDKFSEVIGNLLNNAIKYSPNGGNITLAAQHGKESNLVVISIADEGIGIGNEDKDTLFTTFHRIQRPETKSIKGSGLGLYIVKEWTKAMNGEVWIESEVNKGSTFYISIPVFDKIKQ